MGLGYDVNKNVIDMKSAGAVIALRSAFEKVEIMAEWLADNPSDGTNDPLVTTYGYTVDEAYALRVFFETFNTIRINNESMFDVGRKMTGLE